MNLTNKQIEIMKVVVAAAAEPVDLDQLLERLPYTTSKESLQFSLRALERHSLIDRSCAAHRRGRLRRLVQTTEIGRAVIGGTGRPAPGPGAAVSAPSEHIFPEPQVSPVAIELEVTDSLPEPESLSLPELDFPEPEVFFEEVVFD